MYLNKYYKDSIYTYIKNADQREVVEYKYSDLGYYMLKEVLETTYQKPLATLLDEEFYQYCKFATFSCF
mgnify:CR=1 FL=1